MHLKPPAVHWMQYAFHMVHICVSVSRPAFAARHSRNTGPVTIHPRRLPETICPMNKLLWICLYLGRFIDERHGSWHSFNISRWPSHGIPASGYSDCHRRENMSQSRIICLLIFDGESVFINCSSTEENLFWKIWHCMLEARDIVNTWIHSFVPPFAYSLIHYMLLDSLYSIEMNKVTCLEEPGSSRVKHSPRIWLAH